MMASADHPATTYGTAMAHLGRQPHLPDRDADGAADPHQAEHEGLGPPVHGEAGHRGVRAGDGEEDRGVVGATHAPAANG